MIARRSLDFGCRLSPDEIIVTNGCIEALNLAVRAVARPGDTIALESPTYFTLLQIIESLGMKALAMLKFINSVATPELPQAAIAEFMANGGYDHHLRRLRADFARQVQETTHAIAEFFPKGTKITRPAGGFVLWVELPPKVDSLELFRRARSAHQHSPGADVHHHQALSQLHSRRLRPSVDREDRKGVDAAGEVGGRAGLKAVKRLT